MKEGVMEAVEKEAVEMGAKEMEATRVAQVEYGRLC